MSDAEVLWSLPAACGQVEDRSGSHVGSFGIMGIIIATGGAFSITHVQAGTWGRPWGMEVWLRARENITLVNSKELILPLKNTLLNSLTAITL